MTDVQLPRDLLYGMIAQAAMALSEFGGGPREGLPRARLSLLGDGRFGLRTTLGSPQEYGEMRWEADGALGGDTSGEVELPVLAVLEWLRSHSSPMVTMRVDAQGWSLVGPKASVAMGLPASAVVPADPQGGIVEAAWSNWRRATLMAPDGLGAYWQRLGASGLAFSGSPVGVVSTGQVPGPPGVDQAVIGGVFARVGEFALEVTQGKWEGRAQREVRSLRQEALETLFAAARNTPDIADALGSLVAQAWGRGREAPSDVASHVEWATHLVEAMGPHQADCVQTLPDGVGAGPLHGVVTELAEEQGRPAAATPVALHLLTASRQGTFQAALKALAIEAVTHALRQDTLAPETTLWSQWGLRGAGKAMWAILTDEQRRELGGEATEPYATWRERREALPTPMANVRYDATAGWHAEWEQPDRVRVTWAAAEPCTPHLHPLRAGGVIARRILQGEEGVSVARKDLLRAIQRLQSVRRFGDDALDVGHREAQPPVLVLHRLPPAHPGAPTSVPASMTYGLDGTPLWPAPTPAWRRHLPTRQGGQWEMALVDTHEGRVVAHLASPVQRPLPANPEGWRVAIDVHAASAIGELLHDEVLGDTVTLTPTRGGLRVELAGACALIVPRTASPAIAQHADVSEADATIGVPWELLASRPEGGGPALPTELPMGQAPMRFDILPGTPSLPEAVSYTQGVLAQLDQALVTGERMTGATGRQVRRVRRLAERLAHRLNEPLDLFGDRQEEWEQDWQDLVTAIDTLPVVATPMIAPAPSMVRS